jgi:CheY-like chemotaxis protein
VTDNPLSTASKTVLVVDPEPISRNVFVRALERLGYNVFEAVDADEALASAGNEC